MRIVMVHPHDLWYDPWTIRILALARELMQRGHHVDLCHMPRKDTPDHPPLREPSPDDPPIHAFQPRQHHVRTNLRLLAELASSADVIHLQKCFPASALPVLWTSQRLGKPLHYDWDDNETAIARIVEKRFWARLHLATYEKAMPTFASTLTYASWAIREQAIRLGFPRARTAHVPVGADIRRFDHTKNDKQILASFGLSPERLTVVYIGQMEGAAHVNQLIDAAPAIVAQQGETQFLLVGGGEQLSDVEHRAASSPVHEHIHVAGYVPHDTIPAIVGAADICVACFDDSEASRAKSPLKIAEYLAAGKPIVASAVGDVPWMIEGSGIGVPPGAEGLTRGILEYATNPQRRTEDAANARQRALDQFTWSKGAETMETMYTIAVDY